MTTYIKSGAALKYIGGKITTAGKIAIVHELMKKRVYWKEKNGKRRWKYLISKSEARAMLNFGKVEKVTKRGS